MHLSESARSWSGERGDAGTEGDARLSSGNGEKCRVCCMKCLTMERVSKDIFLILRSSTVRVLQHRYDLNGYILSQTVSRPFV